jgi:glycine dehydrogenase
MLKIREEIDEIESGKIDKTNNTMKNSPHTQAHVCGTEWNHPYSREKAAFPLDWVLNRGKYWPTVGRIDNVYGDKHIVCTCPSIESYE